MTGWEPGQAPPRQARAPDLAPVPVPSIAETPPALDRLHLEQTEPMDDPGGVALQVALLTATVRELVARVEALERKG